MAQISLQNNTSFWLILYIDGNFGCGPVMPSGFCTSSITPGSHVLDARKRGEPGTTIASESVNIGDGTSPTWTVTIKEAPTLEGKWMVQSSSWSKTQIGKYWTFTRSGGGYTFVTGTSCPDKTYYGGPTEFTASFTPDYACLLQIYDTTPNDPFSRVLQQLAGKITFNERITLSPDGNSATYAIDDVTIYTSRPSGVFSRIEVNPLAFLSTLVRVSLR